MYTAHANGSAFSNSAIAIFNARPPDLPVHAHEPRGVQWS